MLYGIIFHEYHYMRISVLTDPPFLYLFFRRVGLSNFLSSFFLFSPRNLFSPRVPSPYLAIINGLYGLFGQGSLNHIFFSYCEHRVLGGLVDVSPGGQPEKVPQGRDSQGGSCHWRVRGKIYLDWSTWGIFLSKARKVWIGWKYYMNLFQSLCRAV